MDDCRLLNYRSFDYINLYYLYYTVVQYSWCACLQQQWSDLYYTEPVIWDTGPLQ